MRFVGFDQDLPPGLTCFINTLFLQIGVSMSSLFSGTDRISLRLMPFKPHEWLFKLRKWAFRSFKTRSLRGWEL